MVRKKPDRGKPWISRIKRLLEGLPQRVFTRNDFSYLFAENDEILGIPPSMPIGRVLKMLLQETILTQVEIVRETAPELGKKIRYVWGSATPYSIGNSLMSGSYLSHSSAMFLHALTDQVPKTVYVNKEQSPKSRGRGSLSQSSLDRAFRSGSRASKYIWLSPGSRYVLLSGKNTGRLEVSDVMVSKNETVSVTKLERTLIDICVRPAYSGGVFEVLRAFRSAKDRVSVNTLVAVLAKLDHLYPYHQAIGFYMERAGYEESHLKKLEDLGMPWRFYLDYQMKSPEFDERWNLYYPQSF